MNLIRFTTALLAACLCGFSSSARAQGLSLQLVADAQEIVDCPGGLVHVTLRLQNPGKREVGGFQVFLGYPTQYFEAVGYEPLAVKGSVAVNGRPPLGDGYDPCPGSAGDPWSDGVGRDVASVVASVYGGGASAPLKDASADLGQFIFRPRGVPTDPDGATFSVVEQSCQLIVDQTTLVFGPTGDSLESSPPAPLKLTIQDGGPYLPNFLCTDAGDSIRLSWDPAQEGNVRGYRIYRNSELIRALNIPGVFELKDTDAPAGDLLYEIAVVRINNVEGCRSSCRVERQVRFVRGDADRKGGVTLTDAVAILDHLFRGKPVICEDAADADDNGRVDLTDAVTVLARLFQGAPGLPSPYPDPGVDPTPDSLSCAK